MLLLLFIDVRALIRGCLTKDEILVMAFVFIDYCFSFILFIEDIFHLFVTVFHSFSVSHFLYCYFVK